jgi:hypothetical protein
VLVAAHVAFSACRVSLVCACLVGRRHYAEHGIVSFREIGLSCNLTCDARSTTKGHCIRRTSVQKLAYEDDILKAVPSTPVY